MALASVWRLEQFNWMRSVSEEGTGRKMDRGEERESLITFALPGTVTRILQQTQNAMEGLHTQFP